MAFNKHLIRASLIPCLGLPILLRVLERSWHLSSHLLEDLGVQCYQADRGMLTRQGQQVGSAHCVQPACDLTALGLEGIGILLL